MKSKSIFGDSRLDKQYKKIVSEMSASGTSVINRIGDNIYMKKSAYRFINNESVTVDGIEKDLVNQTVTNINALGIKEVLIAQDTMDVVREGIVKRLSKGGKTVLECSHTNKGMRSHSGIAMDAETGIPAGFVYLKIWGRTPNPISEVKEEDIKDDRRQQPSYYVTDPDTGERRYKYSIPLEQRDSESSRWIECTKQARETIPMRVHCIVVQDREGDMYPLLTLPGEYENLDIVVRASKRRTVILESSTQDIFDYTLSTDIKKVFSVSVGKGPHKKGREAEVALRYGKIRVRRPHSPVYKQKYVDLYFVRVTETAESGAKSTESVDWLLLTSIPVDSVEDADRIIRYYRMRWFIEDFHRLLKKKGFGIEDIQVESPHAFEINLSLCIKAAYEIALVKKGFDSNDETTPATIAFSDMELDIVSNMNNILNSKKKFRKNPHPMGSLAWAAWIVACEGGWSAIPSQPKPGIITFKRGIDKIENIYQYLRELKNLPICG